MTGPSPERLSLKCGESADTALGGAVGVIQPKKGFRFSIDAIFLARFAAEHFPSAEAVDLCSGSGVVGFSLLALGGAKRVTGIEISPAFVDMATRAAFWNGCDGEAAFLNLDLRETAKIQRKGRAGLVVCNPPFLQVGRGHPPKDEWVYAATHEARMVFADAARAAAHLLGRGGAFCVVYPAERVADAVCAMREASLEPKIFSFLYPRDGELAKLALVGAVKGAKEGAKILPPVFLHPKAGGEKYTREVSAILGCP